MTNLPGIRFVKNTMTRKGTSRFQNMCIQGGFFIPLFLIDAAAQEYR
jgi:hypothetical protein